MEWGQEEWGADCSKRGKKTGMCEDQVLKKQVGSKAGGKNADYHFSRQNKALAFPAMVEFICVTEVTRGAANM